MQSKVTRSSQQDEINKLVGCNLQYLRKLNNLTLIQLAKELQVKFQQVQKYESGHNQMNSFRLYKAAKCLNVPTDAFFDEKLIAKNKAFYEAKFFGNGEVKGKDFQNALAEQFEEQCQTDDIMDHLKGRS